jgi:hypothetical protein
MNEIAEASKTAHEGFMLFGIDSAYYFLTGIGAFVLFFRLEKNNVRTFEVVGYINPKWKPHPLCRFSEAIIFCVLGAIVGTAITHPINPQQAIFAGLGWTGLLTKTSTNH